MKHPTFPLQHQQADALQHFLEHGLAVDAGRFTEQFNHARDLLYPGWMERHHVAVQAWAKLQLTPMPAPPTYFGALADLPDGFTEDDRAAA